MAMKDYSDEFKADAVALYESTPGATCKSIGADLGVSRAPLREWVLRDRERRGVTAAAVRPGASPRHVAVGDLGRLAGSGAWGVVVRLLRLARVRGHRGRPTARRRLCARPGAAAVPAVRLVGCWPDAVRQR